MKQSFFTLGLALSLTACDTNISASSDNSSTIQALTGSTLIDGNGGEPILNATILIEGGKITCAGNIFDCPTPDKATNIQLNGKYITPGIVDGHVHFSQTGFVDGRPDGFNANPIYPFGVTQAENRNNPDRYYKAYICSGVTAVYDVGGFPYTWDFRADAEKRTDAPHIAAAGPLVTHGAPDALNTPAERSMIMLSDPETGKIAVNYIKASGSDAVKVWYLRPREGMVKDIQARVQAVGEEAARLNIPLIVHANGLREAKHAVRLGAHLLVHNVWTEEIDNEFIEMMKAQGTYMTPTMTVARGYYEIYDRILNGTPYDFDDANSCIDTETKRKVEAAPELGSLVNEVAFREKNKHFDERLNKNRSLNNKNLKRLYEAGVRIAMGTDAGNTGTMHGPSVYSEMEAMQAAGMTPMDVLISATRIGAEVMSRQDDFGTIESGKIANLIILTNNPTENIKNMRSLTHVMRGGKLHNIKDLKQ
ncbi:MAG: amidohydrolase family protein [Sphingomonadales bacterium]